MKSRSIWFVLSLMTILWTAMPSIASAQPQIGLLAGFDSANINFDAEGIGITINGDRRSGFVGGLSVNVPLQDMFSVELDALWAQKGTQFTFDRDTGKIKLNYMDVPVMGRITLSGSGSARVHLLIGPPFNFKISEKFDPEDGNNDEDQIETFETALVIGGGVTVTRIGIEVRYGMGLSNIVKDSGNEGFTGKNKVFSILLRIGS